MNTSALLIASIIIGIASLVMALYALLSFKKLRDLRSHFSLENQPENLEDIVSKIVKRIKQLEDKGVAQNAHLKAVEQQLSLSVQKIGIHRFNGLGEEGGKLSFALALLDQKNSGIVFTSLHGRQYSRIYTKSVEKGLSETQLSTEEQAAIKQAQTIITKPKATPKQPQ
jgi:hypothetical protein